MREDDDDKDVECNVIPIRPAPPPEEAFLIRSWRTVRARSNPACTNHAAIVDKESRKVYCKHCDVDLDPIAVLSQIADNADWVLSLRRERQELRKEIEALRRELASLKASTRRLKKKSDSRETPP